MTTPFRRRLLNNIYEAAMQALLYPGVTAEELKLEVDAAVDAHIQIEIDATTTPYAD